MKFSTTFAQLKYVKYTIICSNLADFNYTSIKYITYVNVFVVYFQIHFSMFIFH